MPHFIIGTVTEYGLDKKQKCTAKRMDDDEWLQLLGQMDELDII